MSMMRASGAMPTITARHMATASFAVPKSVIKTIVGLCAAAEFASFGEEVFAHPAEIAAITKRNTRYNFVCSQRGMVVPSRFVSQYSHSAGKFRFAASHNCQCDSCRSPLRIQFAAEDLC